MGGVSSVLYSHLYASGQSGRPAVCTVCVYDTKESYRRPRPSRVVACKLSKAVVSSRRFDAQDARRGTVWCCRQRVDIC